MFYNVDAQWRCFKGMLCDGDVLWRCFMAMLCDCDVWRFFTMVMFCGDVLRRCFMAMPCGDAYMAMICEECSINSLWHCLETCLLTMIYDADALW